MRPQIDGDLLARGCLVLTEVVTNSVKHARLKAPQTIDLHVWVSPHLLRLEVLDDGPGFDREGGDGFDGRPGGWGLLLIDRMTDRWGVDCSHSTRVWLDSIVVPGTRP